MAAHEANETVFQKSLSRFLVGLGHDEKQDFKFTTLQDVKCTIRDIQNEHGQQLQLRNMTRIRGFIEAMDQFGTVIEVMLNSSNFIAFIWGPVKVLLMITKTWTESLDILLDAYERIGETIPLLIQYQDLLAKNPHMQRVLGYIYQDILEFHRRALVIFRRKAWKQLFHSTWKTFQTKFNQLLESIRDHVTLIERQASLIEIEANQEARKVQEAYFSKMEESGHKQQILAIVEKVSPVPIEADQDKAAANWLKEQSFGLWLLENIKMKAWLDVTNAEANLLWLKGIPGAGKTVLISRLIAIMEEMKIHNVIFFYCKGEDNLRNSLNAILKSFLCQLLTINPDVLPYLYEKCVQSREATIESFRPLRDLVAIAMDCKQPLFLVVDGLDECETKERKKIFNWILSLIGPNNGCNYNRLLIVSRDEGDFGKRLSKTPCIILQDTTAHSHEIRIYTNRKMTKIQKKFGISPQETAEIGNRVTLGAKGMFLFARLVLNHLKNQTSLIRLRTEVNPSHFPEGLNQVYERIVRRVYTNPHIAERESAILMLEWIVCAKRTLRWNELQAIFSLDLNTETVDFEGRCLRPNALDQCHSVAKRLCGSLVEISNDIIHLVHHTAKINNGNLPKIDIKKQQFEMAKICLQYLSIPSFDSNLTDEKIVQYLSEGYYAFQDYSVAYFLDHFEAFMASASDHKLEDLMTVAAVLNKFLSMNIAGPSEMKWKHTDLQPTGAFLHLQQLLSGLQSILHPKVGSGPHTKICGNLTVEIQLKRRRDLFETLVGYHQNNSLGIDDYQLYYGPPTGWFKCPTLKCYGFWEGFETPEAREAHIRKHIRPFRCSYMGCPYGVLGFEKYTDLDKHQKKNHVAPSEEAVFPEPDAVAVKYGNAARGKEDASVDGVLSRVGDELGRLNIETVPMQFKTTGTDWYAIFNPRESESLDIELLRTFEEGSLVCSVAFNNDDTLVGIGIDRSLVVFQIDSGLEICRIATMKPDFKFKVFTRLVVFSPLDNELIASCGEDKLIKIWNFRTSNLVSVFEGHENVVYTICYAHNGRKIASASSDWSVRVWNVQENSCESILNGPVDFSSAVFSPDDRLVAAGSVDNSVYIWEIASKSLIHKLGGPGGHTDSVFDVYWGHHIYTPSLDRTVKIWQLDDYKCSHTINCALDFCLSVAASSDQGLIFISSKDTGVYIYDDTKKCTLSALLGHKYSIVEVRASLGSTKKEGMFATASLDKRARLWRYSFKDRSGSGDSPRNP